jgi:hypothetical protein
MSHYFRDATERIPPLFRKTRAQLFLLCFAIVVQPVNVDRQLLFQRFHIVKFARVLHLSNFAFQEKFSLRDFRFEARIDFSELRFLLFRQDDAGLRFLQSFHC